MKKKILRKLPGLCLLLASATFAPQATMADLILSDSATSSGSTVITTAGNKQSPINDNLFFSEGTHTFDGSSVEAVSSFSIGRETGKDCVVTFQNGSTLTTTNMFHSGMYGGGTTNITGGSVFTCGNATLIGYGGHLTQTQSEIAAGTSVGVVNVSGAGSKLILSHSNGYMDIGGLSYGGHYSGKSGTLNVSDSGAVVVPQGIYVGFNGGEGYLNVSTNGTVQAKTINIGSERSNLGIGAVTVESGGKLTADNGIAVGSTAAGSLTIGQGGTVSSKNFNINSTGLITLDGGTIESTGNVNVNRVKITENGGTIRLDGTGVSLNIGATNQIGFWGTYDNPINLSLNNLLEQRFYITLGAHAGTTPFFNLEQYSGNTLLFFDRNSNLDDAPVFLMNSTKAGAYSGTIDSWAWPYGIVTAGTSAAPVQFDIKSDAEYRLGSLMVGYDGQSGYLQVNSGALCIGPDFSTDDPNKKYDFHQGGLVVGDPNATGGDGTVVIKNGAILGRTNGTSDHIAKVGTGLSEGRLIMESGSKTSDKPNIVVGANGTFEIQGGADAKMLSFSSLELKNGGRIEFVNPSASSVIPIETTSTTNLGGEIAVSGNVSIAQGTELPLIKTATTPTIAATFYVTGIGMDNVWKKSATGVSVLNFNDAYDPNQIAYAIKPSTEYGNSWKNNASWSDNAAPTAGKVYVIGTTNNTPTGPTAAVVTNDGSFTGDILYIGYTYSTDGSGNISLTRSGGTMYVTENNVSARIIMGNGGVYALAGNKANYMSGSIGIDGAATFGANGDTSRSLQINSNIYSVNADDPGTIKISNILNGMPRQATGQSVVLLGNNQDYHGTWMVGYNNNPTDKTKYVCGSLDAKTIDALGTRSSVLLYDSPDSTYSGSVLNINADQSDLKQITVGQKGSVKFGADTTATLDTLIRTETAQNYSLDFAPTARLEINQIGTEAHPFILNQSTGTLAAKLDTMTLYGDYNQGADAILELTFNAADTPVLSVIGNADFDGTIDVILAEGTTIDPNSIYTLIDVSEALEAAGVSYNLPHGYLAGVRDGAIVLGSSNAIPEPSSWILLVLGALGIILTRQFQKGGCIRSSVRQ